MSIGLYKKPII